MEITLVASILAKCQQDGWYGPDYYNPRRFEGFPVPDFDSFPDEEGNLPVSAVDTAQHTSSLSLANPEQVHFTYAKATSAQITLSEQRLGFPLPSILRDLYQKLANGGFGPGTGIRGIAGGYPGANGEGTLLDFYPTTTYTGPLFDLAPVQSDQQEWVRLLDGQWPRRVVCFADMGCVQEACVDAASSRMYLRVVTEEDRYALLSLPWTLEEWLWRWVRGESLLDISRMDAA